MNAIDPLVKMQTMLTLLKNAKDAAYKLGYAEGALRKHLSDLSPEELEAVHIALEAFSKLKPEDSKP